MESFEELNLSPNIKRAILEMGFEKPSLIQQQALPILLGEPTDFIGLAATGTGKTAAFGIPLLERIDPKKRSVQGLVMCPTRELAMQVAEQISLIGKYLGIKALPIYGGADYAGQLRGLKQGAQVVVGTPGRLIDHLERGTLKLDTVQAIILDEADEMISMGFKDELEAILKEAPRETSSIWLFAATMSKEVRRVADTYLRDARQVQVNRKDKLSDNVEQIFYASRESDKPEILCKIIETADDFFGIVFCQTKSLVTDLAQFLTTRGYKVDSLHGDKDQRAREKTMQAFRDRAVKILICTDVASRGLDVKDVTHVVNYSIPRELEIYVHRIGRTARSGKSGIAINLVTPAQRGLVSRVEMATKSKMREGKIPNRKEIGVKRITKILEQFRSEKTYVRAIEILTDEWKEVIAQIPPEEIVARFLTLSAPDIFHEREKKMLGLATPVKEEAVREHRQGRPGGDRKGGYRRERSRHYSRR